MKLSQRTGQAPAENRSSSGSPAGGRHEARLGGREAAPLVELAGPLRVLADPTRLLILESLFQGVQCNCNIREVLDLPMNLISHHIKILREAGLVRAERDPSDARWVYYQVEPEAIGALRAALSKALDPERLKPRRDTCGPLGCHPTAQPLARESNPGGESDG